LIDFAILVFLARYLGTDGFGKYSYVFAYLFFFEIIPTLGMNKIIIREIVNYKKDLRKIIGNALTLRMSLSIFAIFLSLIVINYLNTSSDTKILVLVASLTLFLSAIRKTFHSLFAAHLEVKYSVVSSFVGKIAFLILITLIIFLNGTLFQIIVAFLVSKVVDLLVLSHYTKRYVRPKLIFEWNYSKKILKEALPLALVFVFGAIYHKIDIIMLANLKTEIEIGHYAAAYKLTESLNMIPIAIMVSIYPLMSSHFSSKESLKSTIEYSLRLLLMIIIPIAVFTTFFSKDIINIIYGSEFSKSTLTLSILIWSEVFIFLNLLFTNILISMKRETIIMYITITLAVFNIILNYIFIPPFSFNGASVATFFTETLASAVLFYYIYKYIYNFLTVQVLGKTISRLFFVNGIMSLLLFIFDFLPIYASGLLFIIVYFWLLIIFKCASKDEINILKEKIREFKNRSLR
jgi:O-antigen/teichoic acid export membrane protein